MSTPKHITICRAFDVNSKTHHAANGYFLLCLLRHQADIMKEKKHGFVDNTSVLLITLHFYAIKSTSEMTQVRKQAFPVGICGKTVGFSETCHIYSDSTILILGDSNVRALISAQFDTAGKIVIKKVLKIEIITVTISSW